MKQFAAISLFALVASVVIVALAQASGYGYSAPSYGHSAPSYGQNYERKTGFKTVSIRNSLIIEHQKEGAERDMGGSSQI